MGDTNLDSAQLFEELSEWIYEKNEKGEFPKIQGIIPLWLEVVSSGAQKKTDSKSAVYEIKLRLVYEKEK